MSTVAVQKDLQDGLLSQEPIERGAFTPECVPSAFDGYRRSLVALAVECRHAARGDADLRHLLVVRVDDDPNWRRWTPFNGTDQWCINGLHRVGGFWQDPEVGLMGWFYDALHSTPSADAERLYGRIATEAVGALSGLLGTQSHCGAHAAMRTWTLDLYRSAWHSNSVLCATRCFRCGVANVPWEDRDELKNASHLAPAQQLMATFYRLQKAEPTCWFAILEPGLFTASAVKIDAILGVLSEATLLSERPWRSGRWIDGATDGELTADRLLKAQRNKSPRVVARKVGRRFEYDLASVCAYAPEQRAKILGTVNAELRR